MTKTFIMLLNINSRFLSYFINSVNAGAQTPCLKTHNTVILMLPTKYMWRENTPLEDTFVSELISYHPKHPVLTTGVTIRLKKALNMFIHPLFQFIREKISIPPRMDDLTENGSSSTTPSGLSA